MSEPYDVVVLGGGPAGCAAATLLARRAHRVCLVRPVSPPAGALAESIPPSARRVLEELGALEAVEAAGFHPNRGNSVWWAGEALRREEFAADGFHTDRASLETVLVRIAEAAGVNVRSGLSARSAEREGDGWTVACEGTGRASHDVATTSNGLATRPNGLATTHDDLVTVPESGPEADGSTARIPARWLVDATGRRGVLARARREPDRSTTTLAVVRRWLKPGGWSPDLAHHTLVESYEAGWAWSVPLSDELRCLTVMIDQRERELAGSDVDDLLDSELDRTRHVGPLRRGAEPDGPAWACPASLYTSTRFARPRLLLTGDAGSFIDPLSSFGVKKALSSGWLAGIVAHTALVDPEMAKTAVDFFDRREREVYRRYRAISAAFFAAGAAFHGTRYWIARAEAADRAGRADGGMGRPGQITAGGPGGPEAPARARPDPDRLDAVVPEPAVRRAFEEIKVRPALAARRGHSVRAVERPAVEGQRIVLREQLATDTVPEGIRFVRGVDLQRLAEVAPRHQDVPDGWAAYNAVAPPVTLPDYLTALATAFAVGILEHDDA